MRRVGIMGGTFDPIHNGHILLARKAKEQYNLDKVLFMTSGNPPHKKEKQILDAKIRHKMMCLAIEGEEGFFPYDYEVKKDTYSYTVDTLEHILKEEKDAKLYFIIGGDSLHDLPDWYKPDEICKLCTFLVYSRSGYDLEKDLETIQKKWNANVGVIDSSNIEISSTKIREAIKNGDDVSNLIPKKVLEFILRNNLYINEEGTLEEKIKRRLKPERYAHSVSVAKKAVELAKRYKLDEKKAYLAGIAHDCAKNLSDEVTDAKCADYDVILDEYEIKNRGLIHAKLGEKVAKIELGIEDSEVLHAIKWHTLGHPDMTELDKVIYVADMIEDIRNFEGVDEIRKAAFENLNAGVCACAMATIKRNNERKREIHPMVFEVLNSFGDINN